jgi:hypothetical protein
VDWHALDMEIERNRRDSDRRIEEGCREIRERIEGVEQRCKEAGEARRREWEELKGRVMTADEKQEHRSDQFLRLLGAVTDEYVSIARSIKDDMQQQSTERRAETRAQTEALLRILDRLPPLEGD